MCCLQMKVELRRTMSDSGGGAKRAGSNEPKLSAE
jgi:hypothetical protein